jgi:hypothetical protein
MDIPFHVFIVFGHGLRKIKGRNAQERKMEPLTQDIGYF